MKRLALILLAFGLLSSCFLRKHGRTGWSEKRQQKSKDCNDAFGSKADTTKTTVK